MTKIKVKMPNNYKSIFTIGEVNAIKQMERDNYADISENGLDISDFTYYKPENILKLEIEWSREKGTCFFSDDRLDDIDIYIHVIFHDGFKFSDEYYMLSDFLRRENSDFPKRIFTEFSK